MHIKTPIFLVGAERSGTTLLRLMLDNHPQIAFHHEFEFAVDQMDDSGRWPPLEDYYDYLATHRIFQVSRFEIDAGLTYPELLNSFLLQKQQRDNKPLVGATVHHQFHHLLEIWPQAKFIHLIRDGRDVARSTLQMGWAGNLFMAGERWLEAESLWAHLQTRLQAEQHITVRYENLIRHCEAELTRICEFIGVAFDPAIYHYAKRSTYSLPDAKMLQQWRKLPLRQIQLAEARIVPLLKAHGYPLSGLPRLKVTRFFCSRMAVHNRVRNIMYRIHNYSFSLILISFIARRLHWKTAQHWAQTRMNQLDKAHLK